MFSSGNFKNVVGSVNPRQTHPQDSVIDEEISLKIELCKDYAWAAMDETSKNVTELNQLAPTVKHSNKALFVVRVTYYVQVTFYFGLLRRPLSIKLPFVLQRMVRKQESKKETKKNDEVEQNVPKPITKENDSEKMDPSRSLSCG